MLNVAKDVGILVKDDDQVINVMIELDSSRISSNFFSYCAQDNDVPGSSGMNSRTSSVVAVDKNLEMSPSRNMQNGNSIISLDNQEEDWSKVGPKKSKRKAK